MERLHAEIESADGWISFARYMELVLYAPGLGYYAGGAAKLGPAGDFVTAPEISPLFGRTLARFFAQILHETGGDVVELGAGSGRLAAELLGELDRLGSLPDRYLIIEVSGDLRARQEATLAALPAALAGRIAWLDAVPESIIGVAFGNEVLDALPVHLVQRGSNGWQERGVTRSGTSFSFDDRPLEHPSLGARVSEIDVPAGYVSEVSLAAPALVRTLAERLVKGVMLWIDYGFCGSEYYHPQRSTGTLMCHYRHRAHADPFLYPGLQDITAHVDFSAVADAGTGAGLALLGYASQAQFLTGCGITDLLAETSPEDVRRYLPLVAGLQKLLSPAEMGELFKVIAFGRAIDARLPGFARELRLR